MRYRKNKFYICGLALMAVILTACHVQTEQPEQQAIPVIIPVEETLPVIAIAWETEEEPAEEIAEEPEPAEEAEPEIEEPEAAEPEDDFVPYDIPLSVELQRYTYDLCRERGLDFEIVLALMYAESGYRPHVISETNDYGLMQLNRVNHNWLRTELEITDFLDAEQNINAGTFILMNISEKYPCTHQMLMAYNFGEAGARKSWNRGIYSTRYSRKITAKAEELKAQ